MKIVSALAVLGFVAGPRVQAQEESALSVTNVFVIEAEDFNFNRGQSLPVASDMPYLGGAYAGISNAVSSVDFSRVADGSSPLYRGDLRVPMLPSTDLNRQAWAVTNNSRLIGIRGAEWFNYTRTFPPGKYLAYAALSHADVADGLCQGTLFVVTSAATNTTQTTVKKGTFKAPGTGNIEVNTLVPLKDSLGRVFVLDLTNSTTIRYTAVSGAIDYLKFVRAQAPVVAVQPVDVTVLENRPATFSLSLGTDDPAAFFWQTNQVDVPRGTNSFLTLVPTLAADGMKVRCVLTNTVGITVSAEVTLHVTQDTVGPVPVRAFNLGSGIVRISFDEPVQLPTPPGSVAASLSGGIAVVSASPVSSDPNSIDLTLLTPLSYDQHYTVTLSGLLDLASTPNVIKPNTLVEFTAVEFVTTDIGRPIASGSTVRVAGGFDVTGAGTDIGGSSDQFQFGWEPRTGDFDVQGRIASATITDSFLHAGWMARETLATNSSFAAAFASSSQLGCFFETRKTAGSVAVTSSALGGVPVNYPETWLRLRRSGNVFSGYASVDGLTWVLLGTNSFTTISNTVLVGLAVSSELSSTPAVVQFRDLGPTTNQGSVSVMPDREWLGPTSRRTGLVFSEIMYHPKPQTNSAANLEFIEIYNAGAIFEELTGYEITGGVQYQFPAGYQIRAGQFVVIAADPAAVQAAYGLSDVLGPWTGSLNNAGDLLQLKDGRGALKLECAYSPNAPWPVAADGAGPSLVLTRPSYGEADPRAWSMSSKMGGSPGRLDPTLASPLLALSINEVLAHPALGQTDFIELYNHGSNTVDLAGCVITDDPSTNKFRISSGSILPRGLVAFDANDLGFGLSATGETLYLIDPTGTRILDAIRLDAQEQGVSFGRLPDGSSTLRRLSTPTPGASNPTWKQEQVVINEIMFSPISQDSDDEYVELHNTGAVSVDLSGWQFTSGINYVIPSGTTLAPDGYLVVARNATRMLANYPQLSAANTVGNYSGTLSDSGELLALAKPHAFLSTNAQNQVKTTLLPVVVYQVAYRGGGRWGRWSDGGGSSMELIDSHADPLQPASWADSDETRKGEWASFELTDVLDNGNSGYPPNRLQVMLQGPGEALIDDIEVFKVGGTNLLLNGNLELTNSATKWELTGTHSLSTIDTNGGTADSRCLHLRSQGDGDTGINSAKRSVAAGLTTGGKATMKAKIRWLAGWPEVLLRLQGNWMELPTRLPVPKNLGTPGLVNSRAVINAGPAIYDVSHSPALPRANQPVVVSCRASDADGIGALTLRYRFDPSLTLTNVVMLDDGTGGDLIAGDGIYSATIPGRASGNVVFRIEGSDAATVAGNTIFPARAPAQECLIRWNDTIPFGTFGHYHLWNTAATEAARNASIALDNTYRDATLVYGSGRIIYNVGFRDKGSPYHSGSGDYAVTVANDDLLLGVRDRVFGSTGNGGSEDSGLRGRVANWFSRQAGLPYLNAHYISLFRNGTLHQNISEDAEQPSNPFAEAWFPSGQSGELFKIAVWFEDNSTGNATGATMEQFKTTGGVYDLARYRWNWQLRANDSANNYTNFFKLVDAINAAGDHVPGLMNIADMEEWMRVFAYHRTMGNWDSWTFNVGQNMYLYRQPGAKWKLLPWDIDFVLGLGNGATDPLWGGQDPIANTRFYDNPTFRRMLYRAFLDAISGPMQPSRYGPQIEARRSILAKNKISGLSSGSDVGTYIDQRREYLRSQIAAADTSTLSITNNNGGDFISSSAVATISGRAPFAVATIEVNGIPYPVKWTGFTTFAISVPLASGENVLQLVGLDLRGNPVAGAKDSIKATFNGVPQQPSDFVVINEIHYHPADPKASYIELFNRSTTTPFDLSGYRLDGVKYTFPEGGLISPNSYMILTKSRANFALAFGSGIAVFDEFVGSLSSGGEHLALVKPGATPEADVVINDVRFDNQAPWPTVADGFGPSLQLIDAASDTYRVGNWTATGTNDVNRVTPGRANAARQSLTPFPLVWINEVLPNNGNGPIDNAGDHDPFVELYNSGTVAVDLSSYFLTDSYTNLTQWAFPAGTVLGPKGYLVVWLDGEPAETTATVPHASFRIDPTHGSVALVRMQGVPSTAAVMDYVNYANLPVDRSFGSYPDGEPRNRRSFYTTTPGGANDPIYPDLKISINEVMASNTKTLADTANGKFSDWIELYNGGTNSVDLTSYRLTDNLTNSTQFVIPPGYVIAAGGFLLVWADGDPSLNQAGRADLHANFKLSETGESVGLFAPDDRMVDGFTFGPQVADMSLGRYPDGGTSMLVYMPKPTPRKKNDVTNANFPPVIAAIPAKVAPELSQLSFTVSASDPNVGQKLTYALVGTPPTGSAINSTSGLFTWVPDEQQGPGSFTVTVQVTDDGVPALSATQDITIEITEVNSLPVITPSPAQVGVAGTSLRFTTLASDNDLPEQRLVFSLAGGSPLGAGIHPDTGEFSWTPTVEQVGTYTMTVLVTDNGVPPLTQTASVQVTIKEPVAVIPPLIVPTLAADGTVTFAWSAVDGVSYNLQVKESLDDADWVSLGIVPSVGGVASVSGIDPTGVAQRYFRVVAQR